MVEVICSLISMYVLMDMLTFINQGDHLLFLCPIQQWTRSLIFLPFILLSCVGQWLVAAHTTSQD